MGIVFLCTSHTILMNFPYQIVQPLGGTSREMGMLLTTQAVMDLPPMLLFGYLLRRGSSRFWVRLSGVSFFLHALFTWLTPELSVLFVIQLFELLGYGLYAVASVYLVNDLVAPADQVQGQTYFTTANTVGIVISSCLGGWLFDRVGTEGALLFSTLTGAVGMLLVWLQLRRSRAPLPEKIVAE